MTQTKHIDRLLERYQPVPTRKLVSLIEKDLSEKSTVLLTYNQRSGSFSFRSKDSYLANSQSFWKSHDFNAQAARSYLRQTSGKSTFGGYAETVRALEDAQADSVEVNVDFDVFRQIFINPFKTQTGDADPFVMPDTEQILSAASTTEALEGKYQVLASKLLEGLGKVGVTTPSKRDTKVGITDRLSKILSNQPPGVLSMIHAGALPPMLRIVSEFNSWPIDFDQLAAAMDLEKARFKMREGFPYAHINNAVSKQFLKREKKDLYPYNGNVSDLVNFFKALGLDFDRLVI